MANTAEARPSGNGASQWRVEHRVAGGHGHGRVAAGQGLLRIGQRVLAADVE
jgi:hypothetical protein